MASQKMCFPETVTIVQSFLVSVTVSSVVGLFSAPFMCVYVYECVLFGSSLVFPTFI